MTYQFSLHPVPFSNGEAGTFASRTVNPSCNGVSAITDPAHADYMVEQYVLAPIRCQFYIDK